MIKDFKSWNAIKENLERRNFDSRIFCKPRELWICNMGLNIGSEQDGRGSQFSRPVLIFKVFGGGTFWGIPITSKDHLGNFHHRFNLGGIDQIAKLQQLRLLSIKRLERKIALMPSADFQKLSASLFELFKS